MMDIEITVETNCPGFRAMLTEYMQNPNNEDPEYEMLSITKDGNKLEHAKLRSKEFYNLSFIRTAGEAKLLIRDCDDGLVAWGRNCGTHTTARL